MKTPPPCLAQLGRSFRTFRTFQLTRARGVRYTRRQHNCISNAMMGSSTAAALLREPGFKV